jgi:hypothetical protein
MGLSSVGTRDGVVGKGASCSWGVDVVIRAVAIVAGRTATVAGDEGQDDLGGLGVQLSGEDMEQWDGDFPVWSRLKCVSLVGLRRWNWRISSSADTFRLSSHWLSASGYPFHLIKYCSLRPRPVLRESRMFSTSYSSSLSTNSGGGR